ncbi:MAG: hypothetical protein JKY08_03240 [Flavobacteriaceae bacterium]|nr:hypothetical protein [Flavobacteriaceae bacterium]
MKTIIYLGILASILCVFGCKSNEEKFLEKHHVLFCKTKSFDVFIEKTKVKPEAAWDLMRNYSKDNNIMQPHLFYFIIDGYYVFTSYIHPKVPEVNTSGVWVNSKNGEVIQVRKGVYLRAYQGFNWGNDKSKSKK